MCIFVMIVVHKMTDADGRKADATDAERENEKMELLKTLDKCTPEEVAVLLREDGVLFHHLVNTMNRTPVPRKRPRINWKNPTERMAAIQTMREWARQRRLALSHEQGRVQ
jgi:hypothetical protein